MGRQGAVALPLMLAYAALLAWAVWQRQLPWLALAASAFLNIATFLVYWLDKAAAQRQQWRTREVHLHLWSLAGGWAGAWLAQQLLRHKNRKTPFLVVYWLTALAHCAGVAWWLLLPG